MIFLEAIAKIEGFYISGSRAQRNNNPGNIEYGAFAKAHGAIGIEKVGTTQRARFAKFPNAETGFAAMKALFLEHYSHLTVEQAILKYAPPVENDSHSYVYNICHLTGVMKNDKISKILGA